MTDFIRIRSNPAPAGEPFDFRGADNACLRAGLFPAPAARGTVVLMAGRSEFIEKYFEVIGELQQRGFNVATMDWRGQGLSDRLLPVREKGHIADFRSFRADLMRFSEEVAMQRFAGPYVLLTHSMGGAPALQILGDGYDRFACAVLCAPMTRLFDDILKRGAVRAMASYPTFDPNAFAGDKRFLLWGNNNLGTALMTAVPSTSLTRMPRIWRVQETGTVGNVRVRIPLTALGSGPVLIRSTDTTFDNTDTQVPMTVNGQYLEATVDFSSGEYFTFAGTGLQMPRAGATGYDTDGITAGANPAANTPTCNPKQFWEHNVLVEQGAFGRPVGIAELDAHQEAVELRFGQREGADLLGRVLGGDDEEGLGQLARFAFHRDLLFLHGLQQRALRLGAGAVDLVGQQHLGEDRPRVKGELLLRALVQRLVERRNDTIEKRELAYVESLREKRVEGSIELWSD